MKRFFIIPNIEKGEAVLMAQELKALIEKKGGSAVVFSGSAFDGERFVMNRDVPEGTEGIITLGGDGTIIQAGRDTDELTLPILGINMGRLGFLAETDPTHMEAAVDALLHDAYFIEERMMIRGEIHRKSTVLYENLALNDIVLMRSSGFHMISFDFSVNGELIKKYSGDGMILSTPTGSTAYNLSAGGPIVMPSASMILATPLNPHTMLQRSIVLPDSAEVILRVSGKNPGEVSVSFDGTVYRGLESGDEIHVTKADRKVLLLKLQKDSFLEVLRTKLE